MCTHINLHTHVHTHTHTHYISLSLPHQCRLLRQLCSDLAELTVYLFAMTRKTVNETGKEAFGLNEHLVKWYIKENTVPPSKSLYLTTCISTANFTSHLTCACIHVHVPVCMLVCAGACISVCECTDEVMRSSLNLHKDESGMEAILSQCTKCHNKCTQTRTLTYTHTRTHRFESLKNKANLQN